MPLCPATILVYTSGMQCPRLYEQLPMDVPCALCSVSEVSFSVGSTLIDSYCQHWTSHISCLSWDERLLSMVMCYYSWEEDAHQSNVDSPLSIVLYIMNVLQTKLANLK